MAGWQLPQARDPFVDGMVDVEVLTLQVGAVLPAVVEPDEGDPDVVRRAFADQEGSARDAAGLVNQGRGGRPAGIVEHGVVHRRQDAPRTRAARSCPADHTGHAVARIEDESPGRRTCCSTDEQSVRGRPLLGRQKPSRSGRLRKCRQVLPGMGGKHVGLPQNLYFKPRVSPKNSKLLNVSSLEKGVTPSALTGSWLRMTDHTTSSVTSPR